MGLFEAGSWTGLLIGGRRARAACNVASSILTSLRRSGMRRARTSATSLRRVSAVESTRVTTSSRRVLCASDVRESCLSKPLWVCSRASSKARAVVLLVSTRSTLTTLPYKPGHKRHIKARKRSLNLSNYFFGVLYHCCVGIKNKVPSIFYALLL